MNRILVFLLLIPFLFLTGCGGAGEDSNSTTPAPTAVGIKVSPSTTITTNESGLAAIISVSLGSKPTADVTIPINSSDNTEGTADKTSLIFTSANWSTAQTIIVIGAKDTIVDGNQSYTIHLGPTTSTDPSYSALEKFISAINIDVLKELLLVSTISGNTSESGTTATFTVRLGSTPTSDVTIPIQSSNTAEGIVDKPSLTFTPSNWDQNQTVTVTGVADSLDDGNQAYSIKLGPTVSNDSVYNNLNPGSVSVTNLDVRTASFIVTPLNLNTSESGATATFTVRLGSSPIADVTIPVQSSDHSEGFVDKGSLTFTSSNWDQNQTVTVTGVADSLPDGNQVYIIKLGPSVSTDALYNNLNPGDISVTNLDVRNISFVVSKISGYTSEGGTKATFTVRLGSAPTADVTIPVMSSDTTEGTVDKALLTFTPSNWDRDQTVTVTGVDDNVVDGFVTYAIVLGPSASTDTPYNNQNLPNVSVTNLDAKGGMVVVSDVSGNSTDETGGQVTFKVKLYSQPNAEVTVPVKSSDISEALVNKTILTFNSSNWSTPQTVTVTGVDDPDADGDQIYTIQLGLTSSADDNYNNLDPASVSLYNIDVKTGGIEVTTISGNTDETGRSATFQVRLNSQPAADVTIPISVTDPTEGEVDKTTLTFTNSNYNLYQTVTVTGKNDNDNDHVTYLILLDQASSTDDNFNNLNPDDVTVTNINVPSGTIDVVTTISGYTDESGLQAILKVKLASQPSDNVTITSISSSDPTEGTVVSPASLLFTPANYDTFQDVIIAGVDDSETDGNQTYTIILGPFSSADTNFDGHTPTPTIITNVDLLKPYGVTPRISAGFYHNLLLASDGTVWGWGSCSDGQLDAVAPALCSGSFNLPQRLKISGAATVSAGGILGKEFSVISKADGTVWTSGNNSYGQLGRAGGAPLAQVGGLTGITKVSAGGGHVLALDSNNKVWAWGVGIKGQLGRGSNTNSPTPTPVIGDLATQKVTAVAAGLEHSLAIVDNQKVYAWGSNLHGQLGLKIWFDPPLDPYTGSDPPPGYYQAPDQNIPTAIINYGTSTFTTATAIGVGHFHSFAVGIYNGGAATYGWGSNYDNQLTSSSSRVLEEPTAISISGTVSHLSGGNLHSLALVGSTKKVWAWGDNDNTETGYDDWDNRGALCVGNTTDRTTPTLTQFKSDPTTWPVDIAAGSNYNLVLLNDGTLQAAGVNDYGQLGTNEEITLNAYTGIPVFVEDPADTITGSSIYFYAYRPTLSGQPATATTNTSATVSVCKPYAGQPSDYCKGITSYVFSTDEGASWSVPTPIATPINLGPYPVPTAGLPLTVNLWAKGSSTTKTFQTDASAVKVSWEIIAPPTTP